MGVLHLGQCDAGNAIDSFFGNREIQTFAKLPTIRPKMNPMSVNVQGGRFEMFSIILLL